MKITDHVLEGCWYKPSPNHSGHFAAPPTLIVMHYTAGGSGKAAADWLCDPQAQASAHVVVDRDGSILQIVRFCDKAWHAGTSEWKGRQGCNGFSIGIEIANWGFCQQRADGFYYSYAGAVISSADIVLAAHKRPGSPVQGWEAYPMAQLDAVEKLTCALLAEYPSIVDICGHDDINGQKSDPGPAFPMGRYLNLLNPRRAEA